MPSNAVVHRWAALELDKVTELISRKIVSGERQMLVQVYLKRGAHVPAHRHESEQLQYVLEGALCCVVDGEEILVREGEVLVIPAGVHHQAEALADTFALDLFCPVRTEWLSSAGGGSTGGTPGADTGS